MIYTRHARRRMIRRNIAEADVEAVMAKPKKVALAERGALNYWGYGQSGYRIRITVANRIILTVAWADARKRNIR